MNPTHVARNLGNINPGNGRVNLNIGNTRIDMSPILRSLKDLELLARRYQTGTPARIDFSQLIRKIKEAEAIGYHLQAKAHSGQL